jgi:hypothetical protein
MVRATRSRSGGSDRNGDGGDRRERYDDPEEHGEIERRRFHGGLKPTPELYALAREQWYRLPGALVRPAMNTTGGDTGDGDTGDGDREPDQ